MPLTRKQRLICWVAYGLIGLLQLSYRYRRPNESLREATRSMHKQGLLIYACWHQNALPAVLGHAWHRLIILVSRSFDGEIIAFICKHFGIQSVRGSSSRGGREALNELIKLTRDGYEIGITVDGPRGPRYKVKPGVIFLAARTGVPILPTASRGRRTWTLHKSWDHFRVPKPFTEILVLYGPAIQVDPDASDEQIVAIQQQLAATLMDLDRQLASMLAAKSPPASPLPS